MRTNERRNWKVASTVFCPYRSKPFRQQFVCYVVGVDTRIFIFVLVDCIIRDQFRATTIQKETRERFVVITIRQEQCRP